MGRRDSRDTGSTSIPPSSCTWGWLTPISSNPPSMGPLLTLIPVQEPAPRSLPHPLLGCGVQCRIPVPQLCWPGWENTGCLTSANPACASSSSSARSSWVSFARRKQVSHCCTSRASSCLVPAEHSTGLKRHCTLWFWALALHCASYAGKLIKIIKSSRLKNTLKIIKSNHQPDLRSPIIKPCPLVPLICPANAQNTPLLYTLVCLKGSKSGLCRLPPYNPLHSSLLFCPSVNQRKGWLLERKF